MVINKQELMNWLIKEFDESDALYSKFKKQEQEEDYDDYETTISRLTEDGFRHALRYVLDHVKEMEE